MDVLRAEIIMDFNPLTGRGAALTRWTPIVADDVSLRPLLIALLYARILAVHKESRTHLFSTIGALSKQNVRDEGATGFTFPDWTLSLGFPPQHIWPWDLSRDITSFAEPKVYVATLQSIRPDRAKGYFGIHLKMTSGLEWVLAPAAVLIAIHSHFQSRDQGGCYELALLLWQINEFYGTPEQVRLGQEEDALAAALAATQSGNLRAPSREPVADSGNVGLTLSEIKLNYDAYTADPNSLERAEQTIGSQLRIQHFLKGDVTSFTKASFFLIPSSVLFFESSAMITRMMKRHRVIAIAESPDRVSAGPIVLEPLDGALHAISGRDRGKSPVRTCRSLRQIEEWRPEPTTTIDEELEALLSRLVGALTIAP